MAIGEKIKEYRVKKGLTQQELADELGYERSTIAKWESGALIPLATSVGAIAKTLKISVNKLYEN